MNLFACEENVFKWSQTDPNSTGGIRPLAEWAALFSGDLFRRRLDVDYLAKMADYRKWRTTENRWVPRCGILA